MFREEKPPCSKLEALEPNGPPRVRGIVPRVAIESLGTLNLAFVA